jgi:RimJ/RimL family protein N-acetyltransferase
LASETENRTLDPQPIRAAIAYFFDSAAENEGKQEGIWVVRLRGEQVIASLLLTFENDANWWMESVFVIAEERRKGHFSMLYKEAVRLAKERKVPNIKLYVEITNERAQATYSKMGMKILSEKMHSYDFVLGDCSLGNTHSIYEVEKVQNGKEMLLPWVQDK